MCQPIVKKCLDGYNGTIIAYGQTASGKTHTMVGSAVEKGILGNAVDDIYEYILGNNDTREITLWASYMEVYNEQVNDLLDKTN